MNIRLALSFLILFVVSFSLQAQSILINEVMASNDTTLLDEDGDSPDWIELYNSDSNSQSLAGFTLSDNPESPDKWAIPEIVMGAGEFLTIFASGKDRTLGAAHWETIIDQGDDWHYYVASTAAPSNWKDASFNPASWPQGPSGFGYSDDDDATIVPQTLALFVRKSFQVDDINDVTSAFFHVDFDDGFVAYLNGEEIARNNLGIPGTPVPHTQGADTWREAEMYQGGQPLAYHLPEIQSLLQNGENVLAIQVHNNVSTSSDMSLIPFLTLGLTQTPTNPRGINPLLSFSLPNLHTNFKLSSAGEPVVLADATGQIVDQAEPGEILTDVSYGRQPDGSNNWAYFPQATPGEANGTTGFNGFAAKPTFSHNGGFYTSTIALTLNAPTGTIIRYTTDGTEPHAASPIYQNPIIISSTTIIRARGFSSGMLTDRAVSHTFFMNESITLPVISISTAPANLWDENIGIYAFGNNYDPNFPFFGANFWEDWERPVHIELYEPDGNQGFSVDAGIKIFGGWSRGNPQKSLSVFFRGEYGTSKLDYPLFPGYDINTFHSFVLRNSGNDWNNTMLRDALVQQRAFELNNLDGQNYRPAILFLNGEYWGLHNIREKLNEDYLSTHFGVDPDNVDMLELDASIIEGSNQHYLALQGFMTGNSPANPQNYDYIQTQMDIDNFITYQAMQIYIDNTDWPGNNIKFWRPQTSTGIWRWLLFDTDFGLGLFNGSNAANNTLAFATADNGPGWPNPPWSTFMLRRLLQNAQFKFQFINRFGDIMNTAFRPANTLLTINAMQSTLFPEMQRHFDHWGGNYTGWSGRVNAIKMFVNQRPVNMINHINSYFNLPGSTTLVLELSDNNAGSIQVSSIQPDVYPWSGTYFQNVPLTLTAIPADGYEFVRWEGDMAATTQSITFSPNSSQSNLTAVFQPGNAISSEVVINEVNYNSLVAVNPEDWVELYNNTNNAIDLSGWQFRDEEDIHIFSIPNGTTLAADDYVVLCRDTTLFKNIFPAVDNIIGNIGYGFSGGGELLRLLNSQGVLIDFVIYDDVAPWPTAPDGNGPTLSLLNPNMDNALPESWDPSNGFGTPGAINDVFTTSIDIETGNNLPEKFALDQNYPNPFNPRTEIRFELPERQKITLTIYDILGRKVTTLINESLPAGHHRVSWQAPVNIASGIYVYELNGNSERLRRKMILLK